MAPQFTWSQDIHSILYTSGKPSYYYPTVDHIGGDKFTVSCRYRNGLTGNYQIAAWLMDYADPNSTYGAPQTLSSTVSDSRALSAPITAQQLAWRFAASGGTVKAIQLKPNGAALDNPPLELTHSGFATSGPSASITACAASPTHALLAGVSSGVVTFWSYDHSSRTGVATVDGGGTGNYGMSLVPLGGGVVEAYLYTSAPAEAFRVYKWTVSVSPTGAISTQANWDAAPDVAPVGDTWGYGEYYGWMADNKYYRRPSGTYSPGNWLLWTHNDTGIHLTGTVALPAGVEPSQTRAWAQESTPKVYSNGQAGFYTGDPQNPGGGDITPISLTVLENSSQTMSGATTDGAIPTAFKQANLWSICYAYSAVGWNESTGNGVLATTLFYESPSQQNTTFMFHTIANGFTYEPRRIDVIDSASARNFVAARW